MYIWAIIRLFRNKEDKRRILERFAISTQKRPTGKIIWFHAASVGESLALLSLITKLCNETRNKLLITTYTKTSAKIVKEKFPSQVIHQYLPYDSPLFAAKFIKKWQPNLVVWTESDFWPNMLNLLSKSHKIILLNARMSDRSFQRWQKYPSFISFILNLFSKIIPQSSTDLEKIRACGGKNIEYIGNLKYSTNIRLLEQELIDKIEHQIKMRTIIFVASTHDNEEELILKQLKELITINPKVLIFLAPRHPLRTAEVIKTINKLEFQFKQRTLTTKIEKSTQIYLIDTLGEMNSFFSLSQITIIGGSFVNIGGHNIIEPAKFGNIIITGPYTSNFQQVVYEFTKAEAAIQIKAPDELPNLINTLINSPKVASTYRSKAQKLAFAYEEILPKTFNFILKQLD
jgi:3-deoxy-D-manno-octulosonic-acid transferase